jgi:chemotaxis protein CheC
LSVVPTLNSEETRSLENIFCQYITSKTCGALSTLLSEPVNHNVRILDNGISHIKSIQLDPDEIKMCAVRLNGKGDTHIEILYTIKEKYAKKIAAKLMCVNEVCQIDEMGASAIQEVANIMTGSFFNALSNGTGFRVDLSTPDYKNADLHSLVDISVRDVIQPVDNAVIADVELVGESSGAKLHMIIMQNPIDARKLLANHKTDAAPTQEAAAYPVGGENSELDALLDDILGAK